MEIFLIKHHNEIALIESYNKKCEVENRQFRESIAKPYKELYASGHIEKNEIALFGNVAGTVRFSEYIPEEKLSEHIIRLRQFYGVDYYEAIYNTKNQVFYFNFREDKKAIVRVFPLEDYRKTDPDMKMEKYNFGELYIKEENELYKVERCR